MSIDPHLIYAVAEAIANANRGHASLLDVTRAAIEAVHAAECCSVCGEPVQPPVLCDVCAAHIARNEVPSEKTPPVETERRRPARRAP